MMGGLKRRIRFFLTTDEHGWTLILKRRIRGRILCAGIGEYDE